MAKKQVPKSAGDRWLRRCDAAFQCARLHEVFESLSAPYNSGFNALGTNASTVSTSRTSRAARECPRTELHVNWRTLC